MDIINGAVDFLEVLTSINAAKLKNRGLYSYYRNSRSDRSSSCLTRSCIHHMSLDTDAKEKLTRNAIQLLNAVCVILQAIEMATLTLSDEAREKLDLPKWVKLATQTSTEKIQADIIVE